MDSTRVRSSFAFTSIPTIAYFPTTTAVASFTPGTLAAKDAKWCCFSFGLFDLFV